MKPVLAYSIALSALFLFSSCSSKGTKPEGDAKAGQPAAAAPAKSDSKSASSKAEPKAAKRAAENDASVSEKASCKSGEDARLIEIVTRGSGCAVEYTKQNEKSEIATAAHETQHCTNVLQKVKGKLEAAGFSCN